MTCYREQNARQEIKKIHAYGDYGGCHHIVHVCGCHSGNPGKCPFIAAKGQGTLELAASADAGDRIENIDLAAANDAIVIALCSKAGVPSDNDERMMFCQELLERGMEHGMEAEDMWFDPLFLVIKGINKLKRKKAEEPAPEAPAEPSAEEKLLTEIRDLLKEKKE